MNDQPYLSATQNWLTRFIIAYSICPFAKREQERGSIRYAVYQDTDIAACLLAVIDECLTLDSNDEIETSLLIYANAFKSFDDYLDFLALAEELLIDQGYEGEYQLASFHPDYYFDGAKADDPANYTNRSPYPMLHLIRERSIEQAVRLHPDPEGIPQRNIALTRELGLAKLQHLLSSSSLT